MRWLLVALLVACAEPTAKVEQAVDKSARYGLIRDTAAQMGIYNGALLAGIAISETKLSHCWSEATWACMGPASPSCGGGPVIAGSADGPCAQMQGGLGLFQFDAGTYSDTLRTYGPDILTVEGNTAQAAWFVIHKVRMDISGATTWLDAAAWMNGITFEVTDPTMARWAVLLACRYNGCCSSSTTCLSRAKGYRDNAFAAYTDMGAEFWRTADRCSALPADGVIAARTGCYVAGGDPRGWKRQATNDSATTTKNGSPANFGMWIVETGRAGRYHVDVALDGGTLGTSRRASYQVVHAGATDVVTVDQAAATGFVALGDFDFAGTGDEHVLLGDNTGETPSAQLLFDAVRVQPVAGAPTMTSARGCCDAGGDPGGLALGAVVALQLARARRALINRGLARPLWPGGAGPFTPPRVASRVDQ